MFFIKFSPGVWAGDALYLSGLIGLNEKGEFAGPDTITQAAQVLFYKFMNVIYFCKNYLFMFRQRSYIIYFAMLFNIFICVIGSHFPHSFTDFRKYGLSFASCWSRL